MNLEKIIYFGPYIVGSTTEKRIKALRQLSFKVNIVDSQNFYQIRKSIFKALQIRVGLGPLYKNIYNFIIKKITNINPKYLIIENGYLFNKNTLGKIKQNYPDLILIFLTVDSIRSKTYKKIFFLNTLCFYNFVITTKINDLDLYKKLSVKKIIFSYQGIDEKNFLNYNLLKNENYMKSDVVFIGDYQKDRADILEFLIRNGVKLKIFGFNWDRKRFFKLFYFGPALGKKYYKILNNSKIALGFLNHQVGDTYTTRSLEIPAARTLLLAEMTKEHKKLFVENKEAVFFKNRYDLLKKINYYLINEKEREKISVLGRAKVRRLDLTWKTNLKKIFNEIKMELSKSKPRR